MKVFGSMGAMFALFAAVILLAGPWSFSPMHKANVREFNKHAAKVEATCGPEAGAAFRDTIDPDDNSEVPMQRWIERCVNVTPVRVTEPVITDELP